MDPHCSGGPWLVRADSSVSLAPVTFPPPPPAASTPVKGARKTLRVVAAVAAVGLAAALVAAMLVFQPQSHRIEGHSMEPTLLSDDRMVFMRSLAPVARGDIVSYRYPRNPAKIFIGRIVGLPGERLAIVDGVVHIDGRPLDEPYLAGVPRPPQGAPEIRLGDDEYFVLGDNRGNSSDSREWGPVARRLIRKRLVYIWWRTADRGPTRPASDRPSR
jgi:signal peptidase I